MNSSAVEKLFGAAGFAALLFFDLRRRRLGLSTCLRLRLLALLDLAACPLAAGLALSLAAAIYPDAHRLGVLNLRSPAVPALALCVLVLPVLWMEGRKQIQFQRPTGLLAAEWLIFAGGWGWSKDCRRPERRAAPDRRSQIRRFAASAE